MNLTLQVWITILGGTLLALFILPFQRNEEDLAPRLIRSKIYGMMIVASVLAILNTIQMIQDILAA